MPRTGKVTRLWNIQKIQKRRTKPNRKAYYLCRGMISQAILVWKFARDPHNCLFRAQQGVCMGGARLQRLSWAGGVRLRLTAGEATCPAVSQRPAVLSLQTSPSGATVLFDRCLSTFPPQSTLTFVPGKQLKQPANQRTSCCRA